MDEQYTLATAHYIELNPVKDGMVKRAEWSSSWLKVFLDRLENFTSRILKKQKPRPKKTIKQVSP